MLPFLVNLFGNFSSMSISTTYNVHNSSTGATFSGGSSNTYTVLYSPKTGASNYKASFAYTSGSTSITGTVWIQPNGVVVAVLSNGQNLTGSQAYSSASGLLTYPFNIIYLYSEYPIYQGATNTNFHLINTTSVTLGPTTFTVKNYGLTAQYTSCLDNGDYLTYSGGLIQQGTVPGTKMLLITYVSQTDIFFANGGQLSSASVTKITSITKA